MDEFEGFTYQPEQPKQEKEAERKKPKQQEEKEADRKKPEKASFASIKAEESSYVR